MPVGRGGGTRARVPPPSHGYPRDTQEEGQEMLEREIQLLMEAGGERDRAGRWQGGVICQRAKTLKAGRHLYLDSYPIWDTSGTARAREALEKIKGESGTREVQRRINARHAQRRLEQIINANFGAGDLLLTCTYPSEAQPDDEEAAKRDMRNMVARIKRLYKRMGKEVKYVYVIETTAGKRGTRYHHHMILSAGASREAVEALWTDKHGGLCNTRRAQQLPEGLTGWAKYITKTLHGDGRQQVATTRRWCRSRNMIVPEPTVADKKISRRRVERIAREMDAERTETRRVLEALYPGYTLLECRVKTSEWAAGAYIQAVMVRTRTDNLGRRS